LGTIFQNLELYFEKDNFIAVHRGLNPKINNINKQSERDLLWIRDAFFGSENM